MVIRHLMLLVTGTVLLSSVSYGGNFHGGEGHAGYSPVPGPANADHLRWFASVDGKTVAAGSSVAVGNGRVFAYANDAVLCFDRAGGSHLWTSDPLEPGLFDSWSSPVFDPVTADVFIPSATAVYRIDADTGSIVWTGPLPAAVVNASVLVAEDRVAVHTNGFDFAPSRIVVLSVADGSLVWTDQAGGGGAATPACHAGTIYDLIENATDGAEMRAYNAADGTILWTSDTALLHPWFGGLAHSDGYLYAQTYSFFGDGELVKIDAATGTDEWTGNVPSGDATPAAGGGRVIVMGGFFTPTVTAYSTDGAFLWNRVITGNLGWQVSATQAGPYVYAAAGDTLYILDAATGSVAATGAEAGIGGTPVIDGGSVFVPGNGGVYCFREVDPSGIEFALWQYR